MYKFWVNQGPSRAVKRRSGERGFGVRPHLAAPQQRGYSDEDRAAVARLRRESHSKRIIHVTAPTMPIPARRLGGFYASPWGGWRAPARLGRPSTHDLRSSCRSRAASYGFLRELCRPLLHICSEHKHSAIFPKHGYHLVSANVRYRDYVFSRDCDEYKLSVSMHFARCERRDFQFEMLADWHGYTLPFPRTRFSFRDAKL